MPNTVMSAKEIAWKEADRHARAVELQMRICWGCQGAGQLLEGSWRADGPKAQIVTCHVCKGSGLHR